MDAAGGGSGSRPGRNSGSGGNLPGIHGRGLEIHDNDARLDCDRAAMPARLESLSAQAGAVQGPLVGGTLRLTERSGGVARRSLHEAGQARSADPGVRASWLLGSGTVLWPAASAWFGIVGLLLSRSIQASFVFSCTFSLSWRSRESAGPWRTRAGSACRREPETPGPAGCSSGQAHAVLTRSGRAVPRRSRRILRACRAWKRAYASGFANGSASRRGVWAPGAEAAFLRYRPAAFGGS